MPINKGIRILNIEKEQTHVLFAHQLDLSLLSINR